MLAYVLDKYSESRHQQLALDAFRAFLVRNNNTEFCEILQLLVSKRSYFNLQALRSVKHLQCRLQILLETTQGLKTTYLTKE